MKKIKPWEDRSSDPKEPIFMCPDCQELLTLTPFAKPEDEKFKFCPFCGRQRISDE